MGLILLPSGEMDAEHERDDKEGEIDANRPWARVEPFCAEEVPRMALLSAAPEFCTAEGFKTDRIEDPLSPRPAFSHVGGSCIEIIL